MNRQIGLGICLVGIGLVSVFLAKQGRDAGSHSETSQGNFRSEVSPPVEPPSAPLSPQTGDETTESDWKALRPLTTEEEESFALVTRQVARYFAWGEMDETARGEFQAVAYQLGKRGVAQLTRDLDALTTGQLSNRDDANDRISDIDTLRYFAAAGWEVALQGVRHLAMRPIARDDEGRLQDRTQAAVTWEAFAILSQVEPLAATSFVKSLSPREQAAYMHHFAMGRQLGGVKMGDVEAEVAREFGDEMVAEIFPPKGD